MGCGPQVLEGAVEFRDAGEEVLDVVDEEEGEDGEDLDEEGVDLVDVWLEDQLHVADYYDTGIENTSHNPKRSRISIIIDSIFFKGVRDQEQYEQPLQSTLYNPSPEYSLIKAQIMWSYHIILRCLI